MRCTFEIKNKVVYVCYMLPFAWKSQGDSIGLYLLEHNIQNFQEIRKELLGEAGRELGRWTGNEWMDDSGEKKTYLHIPFCSFCFCFLILVFSESITYF